MKLDSLVGDRCPVCKTPEIILEKKVRQHCSGKYNEYREFACGMILHFLPNFDRTIVGENEWNSKVYCIHDPERLAKKDKRTIAQRKVLTLIDKLDTDDEYKKTLSKTVSTFAGINTIMS